MLSSLLGPAVAAAPPVRSSVRIRTRLTVEAPRWRCRTRLGSSRHRTPRRDARATSCQVIAVGHLHNPKTSSPSTPASRTTACSTRRHHQATATQSRISRLHVRVCASSIHASCLSRQLSPCYRSVSDDASSCYLTLHTLPTRRESLDTRYVPYQSVTYSPVARRV